MALVREFMICKHCQAQVQDLAFCPYCGYRLNSQVSYPPQEHNPFGKPDKRARRTQFFRRWTLPFLILLVIIAFGILGLALLGFRNGSQERELANQHQAEIHYNRGLIYLEWGQYELAEAEFEEAVRLVPGYQQAEEKRRIAQVQQTITPSPTALPSPTPLPSPSPTALAPTPTRQIIVIPVAQVLFEEGQLHYEAREWEQAISKLEQLRIEDPTYHANEVIELLFQSHKNYAIELDTQDNMEEAISHYDSALYLKRRDPEIEELRRRADLYIKALGVWNADWESAIVNLTALYALAPDYKDTADRLYQACTTFAKTMIIEEHYCAAADLYEQALEIRADDPEIVKLEDDARHLCQSSPPSLLPTPTPNGYAAGEVHLGTLVATCYDHHTDQYSLCAQDAETNVLRSWLPQADQPALTLDGRMLAYRSTDPKRPGLYAIPLASSSTVSHSIEPTATASIRPANGASPVITITTKDDAHSPTWSPDGKRIAYALYEPDKEDWFIYVASIGDPESRLIHQGEWPSWGPNGLLAFTTCSAENTCGIHIFDFNSWQLHKLTNSIQDRAATWAPSGQELVYTSDIGRSFNLYVVHAETGAVRQITRNLFTDVMPVWSPDGQRIAYVTNRNDDWVVYTLHPFGGQEKQIASLGASSADWQQLQLAWTAAIVHPDIE
jgi:tetratricopeptide (TPR) repeat protein